MSDQKNSFDHHLVRTHSSLDKPPSAKYDSNVDNTEVMPVSMDEIRGKGAVNFTMILICFSVGCATFLNGFDNVVVGPIAGLPLFVQKYQGLNPVTESYVLTAYNQNLLLALPPVGAVCGAIAVTWITHYVGRKWTLIIAYILSLGMVFLQLFAPNYAAFVIGRLGNLAAIGIISVTAPLYLAEVTPASIRGAVVTPLNITATFAGLIAVIVVFKTNTIMGDLSFQIPLAIQCVIPPVLIGITLFLPESPMWLLSKQRNEQARKNLRTLRAWSDEKVDGELRAMQIALEQQRSLTEGTNFMQIFHAPNLWRTILIGAFCCGAYVSGVLISTTYITIFLIQLGSATPFTITVASVALSLAGTIVAPFIVDRLGRRFVALAGIGLMLVIDVIAGGLAFDTSKDAILGIVGLSCILNFVWAGTYQPLSTLVPTEIAKPALRNYTMAYVIVWSNLTVLISNFALPQLTAADGANLGAKSYLVFGGCMAVWYVLTYFCLPETAGRTFAEVDQMYEAKVPPRKWRGYQTTAGVPSTV